MENILSGLNKCNTILDSNLTETYSQGKQLQRTLGEVSSLNSTSKKISKQTKLFKRFGYFFNISKLEEPNSTKKSYIEEKINLKNPSILQVDPIDKALSELKYKSQLLSFELDSQDRKLQELQNLTDDTNERTKLSFARIR